MAAGNHEVMTALGHEGYVTAAEYMEFAEPDAIEAFREARSQFQFELLGSPRSPKRIGPIGGRLQAWEEQHAPGRAEFRRAMGREGWLGRYIRSLPVAVAVGPLVLVHGGLSPMWASLGLEGLALSAQTAWKGAESYYQSLDPQGIFRDPSGPLWHRSYCVSDASAVLSEAKRAVAALGVERMVVGHTRTDSAPGGSLGIPLLRQDGTVLMVDVGMGSPGEPGCVVLIEDGYVDAWSPIWGRQSICSLGRTPAHV